MQKNDKINENSSIGVAVSPSSHPRLTRLYEKLIRPMESLEKDFNSKTSRNPRKHYKKFAKDALKIMFDYDPNYKINGVNANSNPDIHHKNVQVKDASENIEAMHTLDNLSPVSKEKHNDIHNNNAKDDTKTFLGAIKDKKRIERFKTCLLSFFDIIINSFIVSFVTDFLYSFIYSSFFIKEKINNKLVKTNLVSSLKSGLYVFLFSIPMGVISIVLMLSNVDEKIINIIQLCVGIIILAFSIVLSSVISYKETRNVKKAVSSLWIYLLKGSVTFATVLIGDFVIEMQINGFILQYILSDLYLISVLILLRFINDLFQFKILKKK